MSHKANECHQTCLHDVLQLCYRLCSVICMNNLVWFCFDISHMLCFPLKITKKPLGLLIKCVDINFQLRKYFRQNISDLSQFVRQSYARLKMPDPCHAIQKYFHRFDVHHIKNYNITIFKGTEWKKLQIFHGIQTA